MTGRHAKKLRTRVPVSLASTVVMRVGNKVWTRHQGFVSVNLVTNLVATGQHALTSTSAAAITTVSTTVQTQMVHLNVDVPLDTDFRTMEYLAKHATNISTAKTVRHLVNVGVAPRHATI